MKTILFLLSLTSLASCYKEVNRQKELHGSWNLTKIELFKADSLSGSSVMKETTTTYQFTGDGTQTDLHISEDGIIQTYHYDFDEKNDIIYLDTYKSFHVDELTSSELILSDTYNKYKSVYTFNRAG